MNWNRRQVVRSIGATGAVLSGIGNTRTAACATSALSAGVHNIKADYSGDGANAASSSTALSQTVSNLTSGATTTVLGTSENPSIGGTSVTFTATVTGNAPTGTVAFTSDGATIRGCRQVTLSGSGNSRFATCTTSGLSVGTHSIVAAYVGDASNTASSSAPLSHVVNARPRRQR